MHDARSAGVRGLGGDGRLAASGLVLVLGITVLVWGGALRLGLNGEDFAILSRAARHEGAPHVFRPFADLVTELAYRVVGPSARALHLLSLCTHLANAALVFTLVRRLTGDALQASFVGLLFGAGAGPADAIVWCAALSRLLSVLAQLVALHGVVRLARRPVLGTALCVLGIAWQFGTNEEVYGTCLFVGLWALFDRRREAPRPLLRAALASAALATPLVHYFGFARVPERPLVDTLAVGGAVRSVSTRTLELLAGFGLPAALGIALAALGALALLLRAPRRAGAFALLWFGVSFVPHALTEAVGYRAYNTQAALALLLSGALVPVATWLRRRRASVAPLAWALPALVLVGLAAGRAQARLSSWRAALTEVDLCARLFERWRAEHTAVPALLNLDATTLGAALYWFRLEDLGELAHYGFLDGATGWVPQELPATLLGRRFDGSYGAVETESYFAGRPELAPLQTFGAWTVVDGPEAALRLLGDEGFDLTRRCAIDFGTAAPVALPELPDSTAAERVAVEIVRPFEQDLAARKASLRVAVAADTPAVLACLEPWLYDASFRFSADQALVAKVDERRRVRWSARRADTGEELATFFVDAWGLGALLPRGRYELELAWRIASGGELRR